jgi:hypothetical protein
MTQHRACVRANLRPIKEGKRQEPGGVALVGDDTDAIPSRREALAGALCRRRDSESTSAAGRPGLGAERHQPQTSLTLAFGVARRSQQRTGAFVVPQGLRLLRCGGIG